MLDCEVKYANDANDALKHGPRNRLGQRLNTNPIFLTAPKCKRPLESSFVHACF